MEFLEPGGDVGFAVDAGVRIHGGATRRFPQKSLRIYMRSSYESSDLNYPLFPDLETMRFRRFILRNHGNDSGFEPYGNRDDATFIRDPLIHRIIEPLGLDTQAWRPVIVYLNGEYWGVQNLRERQDRHTLGIRHQVNPDMIDLLSGNGTADHGSASDFMSIYRYSQDNDMGREENFNEVRSEIDIKNLADYFITQITAVPQNYPNDSGLNRD